jgi:hypothetical protein
MLPICIKIIIHFILIFPFFSRFWNCSSFDATVNWLESRPLIYLNDGPSDRIWSVGHFGSVSCFSSRYLGFTRVQQFYPDFFPLKTEFDSPLVLGLGLRSRSDLPMSIQFPLFNFLNPPQSPKVPPHGRFRLSPSAPSLNRRFTFSPDWQRPNFPRWHFQRRQSFNLRPIAQ